jgi:Arc/MetJ family transcription regulator
MGANIVLDEKLVEEAFKVSHAKTKKELVQQALKEFIENRKRLNPLELFGKIEFENSYDYKQMREEK